jgi:hypothetical protein
MIVSSLLHGRLWQPYQRRCLRDDSRKLPACAGRAAPSWRAMLCPAFAREKSALRACYALCAVRVGKRGATCSCRHFCSLRGLTPATHLILWHYRWAVRTVPSFSTAREPHDCPFQRILFASVTGAMSAIRDCLWGGWSVLRGPQSLHASVVALVWREAPLCISLLTPAFQAVECATRTRGHILRVCRRTRQQEANLRSAAKWEGTTHGGEREVEVRQNGGVSIRSCFCVSPES